MITPILPVLSPAGSTPLRIPARPDFANRAWAALVRAGERAYYCAALVCALALIGAVR